MQRVVVFGVGKAGEDFAEETGFRLIPLCDLHGSAIII